MNAPRASMSLPPLLARLRQAVSWFPKPLCYKSEDKRPCGCPRLWGQIRLGRISGPLSWTPLVEGADTIFVGTRMRHAFAARIGSMDCALANS